jgi:hypothetical protein
MDTREERCYEIRYHLGRGSVVRNCRRWSEDGPEDYWYWRHRMDVQPMYLEAWRAESEAPAPRVDVENLIAGLKLWFHNLRIVVMYKT